MRSLPEALRVVQDGNLDGAILDVNLLGEFVFPLADALLPGPSHLSL